MGRQAAPGQAPVQAPFQPTQNTNPHPGFWNVWNGIGQQIKAKRAGQPFQPSPVQTPAPMQPPMPEFPTFQPPQNKVQFDQLRGRNLYNDGQ